MLAGISKAGWKEQLLPLWCDNGPRLRTVSMQSGPTFVRRALLHACYAHAPPTTTALLPCFRRQPACCLTCSAQDLEQRKRFKGFEFYEDEVEVVNSLGQFSRSVEVAGGQFSQFYKVLLGDASPFTWSEVRAQAKELILEIIAAVPQNTITSKWTASVSIRPFLPRHSFFINGSGV